MVTLSSWNCRCCLLYPLLPLFHCSSYWGILNFVIGGLLNNGLVMSPGFCERGLILSPGFHKRGLVLFPKFHKREVLVLSPSFNGRDVDRIFVQSKLVAILFKIGKLFHNVGDHIISYKTKTYATQLRQHLIRINASKGQVMS